MSVLDSFPTRQYPYRRRVLSAAADDLPEAPLTPNVLHRFVVGRDLARPPAPLEDVEARALEDPFARLLRAAGTFPLTGHQVVAAIDATGLKRESYVVSDGGHVPWSETTRDLARQTRIVVLWRENSRTQVLLATSPQLNSNHAFLQVISWDESSQAFHFYERGQGSWIFAGSSWDSLVEPTRGKGPFDSHVNGGLVMKELKVPWMHWASQSADDLPGIAPDDPLRDEALFSRRSGAEQLEQRVRSCARRWTRARLARSVADDCFSDVRQFLRQIAASTTANLISSGQNSAVEPGAGRFRLPPSFFMDVDGLLAPGLLDELELEAPTARWDLYRRAVREHGYELRDENGRQAHEGDTHFAFLVPERALEDEMVLFQLIRGAQPLLEPRVAATLLMVDFPNPVASARRSKLLQYVPQVAERQADGWTLGPAIVEAVLVAADAAPPRSPELEFAELWGVGTAWKPMFSERIRAYFRAVQARLDTWDDFELIMQLAESRRRRFRKRPIAEFRLTTPVVKDLPEDLADLEMKEDGSVAPAS